GQERGGVDFTVLPGAPRSQQLRLTISGGTPPASAPSATGPVVVGSDDRLQALRAVAGSLMAVANQTPPNTVVFIPADASVGAAVQRNQNMSFASAQANLGMVIGSNLDPGEWIAVARQGSNGAILHFTVSSGEGEVPINLALAPTSRVTGRVIFEGPG